MTYTVTNNINEGRLDIKNQNGEVINSINLPDRTTIIGPIMVGDSQLAYSHLAGGNRRKGFVYDLPSGDLVNVFTWGLQKCPPQEWKEILLHHDAPGVELPDGGYGWKTEND